MSRRMYFDIEVSPNIVCSWRVGHKLNIDHDNIVKERAVICICYKWENDPKVYSFQWDKKQNDKTMLAKFMRVANQADEIVGHNGDRFDIKWLRARCIYHRIPCPPDFISIDTLKLSRSGFAFNSNRLDYIGKFLGVGRKKDTGGFGLWKSITLDNDQKALKKMVAYCEQDVKLLQRVHTELMPYTKHKTHRAVERGGVRIDCPECTSTRTVITKHNVTAAGRHNVQMKCKDCGKYMTVPKTTLDSIVKKRNAESVGVMERVERGQRINRSLNENARR